MRKFLLVIFSILPLVSSAQKLEWNIALDGLFDNREYKGDMLPQTIYGTCIAPEIGMSMENSLLMGGVSWINEFGASEKKEIGITLYLKQHQGRFSGTSWADYCKQSGFRQYSLSEINFMLTF